jgi:hypothetical protein
MTIVQYNFPTIILFGAGARRLLPQKLGEAKVHRPLLVTDEGVAALDIFADVMSILEGADGLTPGVFAGIAGNPVESMVTAGVEAYKTHGADSLVIMGGGAALDVGKVIALMVNHPGDLFDYEDGKPDGRPVDQPIPYMVALPTTAGTGSEVGRSSVISDDVTKAKKIVFDPRLLPPVVLADPELTLGLPPRITAATGIDALSHNVEAYLSKGFSPMCDGIALEGIRLVAQSLLRCVEEGSDVEARGKLMMASLMGAVAFQKGLGVTHSLAHPLSTVCSLHHGLAIGVMMGRAMRYNKAVVADRMAVMAQAVGVEPTADAFIEWYESLAAEVGIPATLGEVGVKPEHLDDLVRYAVVDVCHQCNPRPVSEEDFRELFGGAI